MNAIGYQSLVWVNDNNGNQFSCTLETQRPDVTKYNQLTNQEKQSCMNVNGIIGTERW